MGGFKLRPRISFASVNLVGRSGYQEGMYRHHLTPSQSLRDPDLRPFLLALRADGVHMDDFTTNGILLPAVPSISKSSGLPLHIGGHPNYNARIIEQLHAIRTTCESIRGDSRRGESAVRRVRELQDRVRDAIIFQRSGHIDRVILDQPNDASLDALIDRLHARLVEKMAVFSA
jgi:A nuclease family of the HNH/ENDO VII superfamily with conserved AHH